MEWSSYLPARVFISPGIDPRRPFFQKLKSSEVRELDFFSEHFQGKVVAVTGTDGKSTFTLQLGEILTRMLPEKKIFVGGNIGTAVCEALTEDFDIAVLEVSSFQAERLKRFEPDFAIVLNLDKDHLDRYDTVDDYHRAKWGLLDRASEIAYPEDHLAPSALSSSVFSFRSDESLLDILKKCIRYLGRIWNFTVVDLAFNNLPTLPHRLQKMSDSLGRTFVNDSKATTVHAVCYAVLNVRSDFSRIHLILGGRSKGDDFTRLKDLLKMKDKVYIYGEAADIIKEQLSSFSGELKVYPSLKGLLESEMPIIESGECVLLSPGCSSFDEFQNFEERGDFFMSFAEKD